MKKILVVDDDKNFLTSLVDLLSLDYNVEFTQSAKEGFILCTTKTYDLVIIDYNMGEMTGKTFVDLLEEVKSGVKILVLSGEASQDDSVDMLDRPIYDFIDKATSPRVLLKKIERILNTEEQTDFILESESERITLDKVNRVVKKVGKEITLTNKEFALLQMFLENKNMILNRDDIYEIVWNDNAEYANLRTVDSYILKLRKKLDVNSLVSERGVGYVWYERNE